MKISAIACMFCVLYLALSLPSLLILLNKFEKGAEHANIYAHFFIYPLCSGWISVLFLVMGLMCSNLEFRKINLRKIIGVSLIVTIILLPIELSSKNYASWEFEELPSDSKEGILLKDYPINASKATPHEENLKGDAEDYQTLVIKQAGMKNWSALRWLYPVGFAASSFSMIALFMTLGLQARWLTKASDSVHSRKAMCWLSASLFASLPYLILRLQFALGTKTNLYPASAIPFSEFAIQLLYAIAFCCLSYYYSHWVREHLKSTLSVIALLLPGGIYMWADKLRIPVETNLSSYLILTLVTILIGSMFLMDQVHPSDSERGGR